MMIVATPKKKKEIIEDLEVAAKKHGQWRDVLGRLFRNKLGMVGLGIVVVLLILIIFAPLLTWHAYDWQEFTNRFAYPSADHPFGSRRAAGRRRRFRERAEETRGGDHPHRR